MTIPNSIMDSNEYFDDKIEGKFTVRLAPEDVMNILEIISEVTQSKYAEGIFLVGFISIEVSVEKIKLVLRFLLRKQEINDLLPSERDELPRKMARFTWHLAAKINERYELSTTNLPDGFKYYLKLDE